MSDTNPTSMAVPDVMARAEEALSDDALAEMGDEQESEGAELADDDALPVPEEGEEYDEDDGPGSKAKPYTVKTLPDAHVTVKIDGEDKVVPLREMVDGYMRQDAFHKRLHQVAQLKERAEQTAQAFKEEESRFKGAFSSLIRDPDELFSFLDEHSPEVLDAVSRKMLKRVIHERDNPQARMEREYAKRQEKLERERDALRREQAERNRTEAEQAMHSKFLNEFRPGYEAGMKKAGYPDVTPEFRATVKGIIAAKREDNGRITAKDVEDAVIRAARAVGAPTVESRRPQPAPKQQVGQRRPQAPQKSKSAQTKTFSQMFRDLGK